MAERNLIERSLAFSQRLERAEAKLRELQIRSNPGAVRSVKAPSFAPIEPATASPAVTLQVSPGRWIGYGSGFFHVPNVLITGDEWFWLHFNITDPSSGLELTGEMIDMPDAQWAMGYTPATTRDLRVPMTAGCDFVVEDDVNVNLLCRNVNGVAYTLVNPRVRLLPF